MLIPLVFFVKRLLFPPPKEGTLQIWNETAPVAQPKKALQGALIYEQFLREFNGEERRYFSRLARECIKERNYPRGENLYQYCYFSTLKYRLERLWKEQKKPSTMGIYVYAQSIKELEYSINYYQDLLEKGGFSTSPMVSPSSWLEERMREISIKPRASLPGPGS